MKEKALQNGLVILLVIFMSFVMVTVNMADAQTDSGSENSVPSYLNEKVDVLIGFHGLPQRELVESFGGDIYKEFTIVNVIAATIPEQAADALAKNPAVRYVEPDAIVTAIAQSVPWGIDRVFGDDGYFFPTWESSTGLGIKVAVLDTGIDENHEDLSVVGGTSTIDESHWGIDGHGHGTHVAGTIAALDNSIGVVGVSPNIELYAVKVLDSTGNGTISSIVAGIEWAVDQDIPVLNMSLGTDSYTTTLEEVCNTAYQAGFLVVAAAGNSGTAEIDEDNVLYPARYASVIAVAASNSNDERAWWPHPSPMFVDRGSSTGPDVELIAPGDNINSTLPGNKYDAKNGTSMASPHAAGVAALVWAVNPDLSNIEVRAILQETAEDLELHDWVQGYGLVRADLAVAKALEAIPSTDANLNSLVVSIGLLAPDFDSAMIAYTLDVEHDVSSIDVTATLSDVDNASMAINGVENTSGVPKTIYLAEPGQSTEISIVVTAGDGITTKTYTITVYRSALPSSDASLGSFTIGGIDVLGLDGIVVENPVEDIGAVLEVADLDGFSGIVAIPSDNAATRQVSLNFEPVEEDELATIPIRENDIVVVIVTPEDGTTVRYYKVAVELKSAPLRINSVSANLPSPQPVDTEVTWTTDAEGGLSPLEYAYYVYKDGVFYDSQWYTESSTFAYSASEEGIYRIRGFVRDAAGTRLNKYSDQFILSSDPIEPLKINSVEPDKESPQLVGTEVTWTVDAEGGLAPLEYAYYVYKDGVFYDSQWYTGNNTFTYNASEEGMYRIRAFVRDATGTRLNMYSASFGFISDPVEPLQITSVIPDKDSPQLVGTEVAWTVDAEGGVAPLEYAYYVYKDGVFIDSQWYTGNNTFTYSASEEGTYRIRAFVRDAAGTRLNKYSASFEFYNNSI